jgi:hypothetical protein
MEVVVTSFEILPGICLEGLRKIVRKPQAR